METTKTDILLEEPAVPKLITAESVPHGEPLESQVSAETVELIEVPEELKPTSTERQLGHAAIRVPVEQVSTDAATGDVMVKHPDAEQSSDGGRYNSGVVPLGNSRFNNGIIPPREADQ